ncbi:hypothetical protein RND81_08G170800 [Saponaria officinalis]|uniref:YTH domain-containing family protein n=1 Tax=Saponaria officinalis TaxID=3572 RepID=A0AAW1JA05_SAPOF
MEEPERTGCSANRYKDSPRIKQERHESHMDNSNLVVGEKMHDARYFIIKSLSYENIQLSVENGIWATQVMNEPTLDEAFNNSRKVILIFSVNASGLFNGYAQMISSVGQRRERLWSQGTGANKPWGRTFKVKWLRLSNLPFYKTLHLKNPLNEYKPVKISRDCQELSPEVGEALCELIDKEFEEDPNMMRSYDLDSGCSFPEDAYNGSPNDMTWGTTYMLHPSLLYQYHSEASMHLAHHGSAGVSPSEYLPTMDNKRAPLKHSSGKGQVLDSPVNSKGSYQVGRLGMPVEMSSPYSTITEDEFLEMTYEEYVEAHDRSTNQLWQPAGSQRRKKEDSSSKEIDSEDIDSNPRSVRHYTCLSKVTNESHFSLTRFSKH